MKERTFLVTGATKGIGFAISSRLAKAGHHVVGVARSTKRDFPGVHPSGKRPSSVDGFSENVN